MNLLQKLQVIFREYFDDPALVIDAKTSPATLPEWDSVAQVHIVLAIEEAFDLRFTMDEVAGVHCVADLLAILEARA
jgi:acyl carrier protein